MPTVVLFKLNDTLLVTCSPDASPNAYRGRCGTRKLENVTAAGDLMAVPFDVAHRRTSGDPAHPPLPRGT